MKSVKAVLSASVLGVFLMASGPVTAQENSGSMILAEEQSNGLRYLAIGAGAVAGIAVLNIVTGGMIMYPLVGAMDSGIAAGVAADGGLGAGVRLSTRWAATALAAVGGGVAGAAFYD